MQKLFAGVHFDGGTWRVSLCWSDGGSEIEPAVFKPDPDGRRALTSYLEDQFQRDPSRASRVILVKSPPESDRLFEALYEKKMRIIPVTPGRLAFHRERMKTDITDFAALAALAAATGIEADILLLESTNICNFRCLYCTQDLVTRKPEKMETGLAKRLIEEYAAWGTGGLGFHLMGEPAIHPDLPEIVAHAAKHEVDHALVSNGTLLDYELAFTLFKSGLIRLWLSLQTFSRDQHPLKRPGGGVSYEQILTNIGHIYRARRDAGSGAEIHIHLMNTDRYEPRSARILSGNEDLRRALRFWFNFSKDLAEAGEEAVFAKDPDTIGESELEAHIWPWGQYDILPGVSITFKLADQWQQNFLEPDEFIIPAKKGGCPLLANERQLAVLCNGDVVMCCIDFDGGTKRGNVKEKSLIEVAREVQMARDGLIYSGDMPSPICGRCLGIRVKELSGDGAFIPEEASGTPPVIHGKDLEGKDPGKRDQRLIDYRHGAERSLSRAVLFARGDMLSFVTRYLTDHGITVTGFLDEKKQWLRSRGELMGLPVWHYSRLPADLADVVLFPPYIEVSPSIVSSLKKRLPGIVVGQVVPLFRNF